MWTLARLLPVMIGHLISDDDPHWKHYLELLEIVNLIFSPIVRPEIPGYLEVLIEITCTHSHSFILNKV